jgi:L-serine dehydratase
MTVSAFDLFKPGIGPSSSHTVGPMVAARRFVQRLPLERVQRVTIELMGSLALTGVGHGTDRAVLLGLSGASPDTIDPDTIVSTVEQIRATKQLQLGGTHPISFDPPRDLEFRGEIMPTFHPNGVRFAAYDAAGEIIETRVYYSVGGGFVLDEDEARANAPAGSTDPVPYPFDSAAELLERCKEAGLTIAELQRANERSARDDAAIDAGLDSLWSAMQATIARGLREDGELPGGLRVKRRAARLAQAMRERITADPLAALDWVNVWALAVNEENAAGGRVVTAPTMGAAGIIPAVLTYYLKLAGGTPAGVRTFLLTAAAIGGLYKRNASISGAEVGCQGEVGVACSMAAAGLTAALGGTNAQIENAAEIGMEHNLGLTCDPVKALVQIPCIERNAVGAVKAIEAARLAMAGDGTHHVTLDDVIRTMKRTGADMAQAYKETSLGGLAANVTAC